MNYKNRLNPWCIIRPLPNMQTRIVGRFRRRSDAEGHLHILKRMLPNVSFEIMFDITPEHREDLTPQPPSHPFGEASYAGKGEHESNSPLLAGEGLGERSTEE